MLISDCCFLKFGCLFYISYFRAPRNSILTPIGGAESIGDPALPGVLVILTLLMVIRIATLSTVTATR